MSTPMALRANRLVEKRDRNRQINGWYGLIDVVKRSARSAQQMNRKMWANGSFYGCRQQKKRHREGWKKPRREESVAVSREVSHVAEWRGVGWWTRILIPSQVWRQLCIQDPQPKGCGNCFDDVLKINGINDANTWTELSKLLLFPLAYLCSLRYSTHLRLQRCFWKTYG